MESTGNGTNLEVLIYKRLCNQNKFDELQSLILEICTLNHRYFDTDTALKIRLAIEHFLVQAGSQRLLEIHRMRRIVEELSGTIEQGVFLRTT